MFIGVDAYLAAGGFIERDLFAEDESGYMLDAVLVEKLVAEKLAAEAEKIRAEGWAWVEHAIDFPWDHRKNFRAIPPVAPALSDEQEAEHENLVEELDELESAAGEDLPAKDRKRLVHIKQLIVHLESFQPVYDENQMAKAGAFVSLDHDGTLMIERGYRRYADLVAEQESRSGSPSGLEHDPDDDGMPCETGAPDIAGNAAANDDDGAELPDKLLTELTAYHSLGLRNAVASSHAIAYLAVLNALVLDLFYRGYTSNNCLQIGAKDTLVNDFPGLAGFKARKEIHARHAAFEKLLPENEAELWDTLLTLDGDTREDLFAHCAGLTVNALHEAWGRSNKRRHALQLAEALSLDMREQGFVATAENYFGRIAKRQILEKVAEAKGPETAELLADLKKKDMAAEAARLLGEEGWLPEPLRTPEKLDDGEEEALPAFLEEPALQAAE